ncbi:serine/threonine-protein kinase [Marinobacteraceae bacterium S3BR75-40.1]
MVVLLALTVAVGSLSPVVTQLADGAWLQDLVWPQLSAVNQLDRELLGWVQSWRDPDLARMIGDGHGLVQALGATSLAVPLWSYGVTAGLVVLIAFYLLWAVPRLHPGTGLVASVALGLVLTLAQALLQQYLDLWIGAGAPLLLLLAGHGLLLFWLGNHQQIQMLKSRLQASRLRLTDHYLADDNLEDAAAELAGTTADAAALERRYQLGLALERRRQFDQARTQYQTILDARRNYRDVPDRLAALEKVQAPVTDGATQMLDPTRTMNAADVGLSRPQFGRYVVEREIGRGAMGIVYLAHDPAIARPVAVKTLSYSEFQGEKRKEMKARFFREAEAAGRLSHPNIVTVYDVGEERDLAFIAMDFVPGQGLAAFTDTDKLLPVAQVFHLMAQVAEALHYAHGEGVVHRDIKPANILYDPDSNRLKITDFGIAKVSDASLTRTGRILGSPMYMSPEQLKGRKVTGASDIYSLGVTLYRLLTGVMPFEGETLAELTQRILNSKPRSVRDHRPELPPSAVRIVNKALQKDPQKRYKTAAEMAEQLDRARTREFGKETTC